MSPYSVLMTVYKNDSPIFFLDSVNSMLKQTVMTDDFVLVCDGPISMELRRTIEIVTSGKKDLFNIIYLPDNVGLGAALHQGLPKCKNDLVARMDSDDISHPDRCEKELVFFDQNPHIDILGSFVNEFEKDPDKPLKIKKVPTEHGKIVKYSRRHNPFNHSSIMFRKSSVICAGNYSDMRTNQDVELWVRMLNKGYIGANIDKSLVDFRLDEKTYERRKKWNNVSLLIRIWHRFWKSKYCSLLDFIFVLFFQLTVFLLPKRILKWVRNAI